MTERTNKELEEEIVQLRLRLEKKEDRFPSFFNNNKSIMLQLDTVTKRIVDANQSALDFYGYRRDELLEKELNDLNTMSISEIDILLEEAVKNKSNVFELKHKVAGGEIRDVEIYATPFKVGETMHMCITIHDITQRNLFEQQLLNKNNELLATEEELRAGNEELKATTDALVENIDALVEAKKAAETNKMYFEALVGNGHDVVTVINIEGDSIYQSPAHEKVLGYKTNEITKNLFDYMHPEDQERLYLQLKEFIPKYGKVEQMNYRYLHKNKTWRCIEGTGENMLNHPIVKGIVLNFRDVTERKETELALKKSEIELRELNKAKDKFFSIIAHDLRAPFNALLGFSSLLNKGFDNLEVKKQKKMLSLMDDSIKNTYKLLEDLLLWSRSQNGTIAFNPENINLYLASIEVEESLKQSAQNKSIKIINNIPEDFYANADKYMFSTIIRNLISNSIKFTKNGGYVSIFAKMDEKECAVITVEDNGVGVSKEIQSRMFDIRTNTSTNGTNNELGTGLGLILCKEFVEKHNGKIWIESKEYEGSSFHFSLKV